MSEAKTIEVSVDAVRELLPFLESKLERLDGEITGLQSDYDKTKIAIAELRARLNGNVSLPGLESKRQRLRKGQGEKIVSDLLKSLPEGHGIPIQEIVNKSGVSYSSVFRMLHKANKGKFAELEKGKGLWAMAKR